jgi:hypothetical protein
LHGAFPYSRAPFPISSSSFYSSYSVAKKPALQSQKEELNKIATRSQEGRLAPASSNTIN